MPIDNGIDEEARPLNNAPNNGDSLSKKTQNTPTSSTTNVVYQSRNKIDNRNNCPGSSHISYTNETVPSSSKPYITVKDGSHPFWLEMSGEFGPEGGVMRCDRSDVSLVIPPGAIPASVPRQLLVCRVSCNMSSFSLPPGKKEKILSPIVELESPGLVKFDKKVIIKLPHRACSPNEWKFAAYFSHNRNGRWESSTADGDMEFSVNGNFCDISTYHFTQFIVCAVCLVEFPLVELEVVAYHKAISLPDIGHHLDITYYFMHCVKDFQVQVEKNERESGSQRSKSGYLTITENHPIRVTLCLKKGSDIKWSLNEPNHSVSFSA